MKRSLIIILFFYTIPAFGQDTISWHDFYHRMLAYPIPNDTLRGVTIQGKLPSFPKGLDKSIVLCNCSFTDRVILQQINVKRWIHFEACTFWRALNWSYSIFSDSATLRLGDNVFCDSVDLSYMDMRNHTYMLACKFMKPANFSATKFKVTDFYYSSFYDKADFSFSENSGVAAYQNATFNNIADFNNAKFHDDANFDTCAFKGALNASSAHFFKEALFKRVNFLGPVNFNNAIFDSSLTFSGSRFSKKVSFYSTMIKDCFFRNTYMPDTIDFSQIRRIGQVIDFSFVKTDTLKDGECVIFLEGTDISKIKLNYLQFRLAFKTNDPAVRKGLYEQLINVQKQYGFNDGLEKLDKEYRDYKNKQEGNYALNIIQKTWWGYGYDTYKVFECSLLIYMLFTIVNFFFLSKMMNEVYEVSKLKAQYRMIIYSNTPSNISQRVNRNLHIFIISMIYTSVIFFGIKFDPDKLHFKNYLGLAYFFLVYTSGIVCLAYMAHIIIGAG